MLQRVEPFRARIINDPYPSIRLNDRILIRIKKTQDGNPYAQFEFAKKDKTFYCVNIFKNEWQCLSPRLLRNLTEDVTEGHTEKELYKTGPLNLTLERTKYGCKVDMEKRNKSGPHVYLFKDEWLAFVRKYDEIDMFMRPKEKLARVLAFGECEGCQINSCSQKDHMGIGGCLYV